MEFSQWLAWLHPRLVAFPIVLLFLALVVDGAALLWWLERLLDTGKCLMVSGTVTLLLAFICGICAQIWAGRAGVPQDQIEWHELAATVAAWGFIALTVFRLFAGAQHRRALWTYVTIGFLLYI